MVKPICNDESELICENCLNSAPGYADNGIFCRRTTDLMLDEANIANDCWCTEGEWLTIEKFSSDGKEIEAVMAYDRNDTIQLMANGGKDAWNL